jgi:hypothetical protein
MTKLLVAAILAISSMAAAAPRLAQAPELPSADRLQSYVRDQIGTIAKLDLRVCVAADGHVQSVNLLHGTKLPQFDRAVMTDVTNWRYTTDAIPRCVITKLEYAATH